MFDITQVLTYPNAKVDTSHPDLPSHISETTRNPRTEDPHEHCNLASNGSSEQGFLFQEEAGVPELVDLSSIMCIYIHIYIQYTHTKNTQRCDYYACFRRSLVTLVSLKE